MKRHVAHEIQLRDCRSDFIDIWLPFLMSDIGVALYVAFGVVGIELLAISFIRYRYFQMRFLVSALQVILGGALVFVSGILIGSA